MPGIIILNIVRIYSYAPHQYDYNGASMRFLNSSNRISSNELLYPGPFNFEYCSSSAAATPNLLLRSAKADCKHIALLLVKIVPSVYLHFGNISL